VDAPREGGHELLMTDVRTAGADAQPRDGWTATAGTSIVVGHSGGPRDGSAPPPTGRPAVGQPPGAAFKEVVRPHLPWLYGLACRLDGQRAEDLVQECLARAFGNFDQLRDREAVAAWLRQILLNLVRDAARQDARRAVEVPVEEIDESGSLYRRIADDDPLPYSDTLHLDFLSCIAVPDIWAVLDRLPAHHRIPLVLVHMYEVPTREVAKALDLPLGTLLSQLHRGRKRFERELWDYAEANGLLRDGDEVLR
jgi:RNA polymerase sigma-70 factor, ECF subfamily